MALKVFDSQCLKVSNGEYSSFPSPFYISSFGPFSSIYADRLLLEHIESGGVKKLCGSGGRKFVLKKERMGQEEEVP